MDGQSFCLAMIVMLTSAAAPVSVFPADHPRTPPRPSPTAFETPATDVWLGRLSGRFEFEGSANPYLTPSESDPRSPRAATGRSDCVHVGSGPGIHCVLNVAWREEWMMGNAIPPHPYLNPSMVLYGIDREGGLLHYLLVNNKGIAEGGTGVLSGNTATFTSTHQTERGLVTVTRIHAPRDSRYVEISVSSKNRYRGEESLPSLIMYLRRVPHSGSAETPAPPRNSE